MAKMIEFYQPKNFRRPLRTAYQLQPGKVIEFRSPTNKSVERSPFIIWKLAGSWKRNAAVNPAGDKPIPPRTIGFAFSTASMD